MNCPVATPVLDCESTPPSIPMSLKSWVHQGQPADGSGPSQDGRMVKSCSLASGRTVERHEDREVLGMSLW